MEKKKRVYTFGNGKAEGNAKMRELLGGKGANLAEMNLVGVPVPPGFTITTDVCTEYYQVGQEKIVEALNEEVIAAVAHVESLMNNKFGDPKNPLLLSVRSGARASMPGMMDTILNLGLNDEVAEGLVAKTNNPHFVYDSYRRFVQMYGDVVLGMKPVNKTDIDPFEAIIEEVKEIRGIKLDKDLNVDELKLLVARFKTAIKEQTGYDFPANPVEQLWGAICAVFRSWMNERAILYRKMEGTIANIIKRNAIPSVDTLEAICKGLGITLSQFFADGDLVEVTPKTRELIDCWSGLSEEQRDAALVLLKNMNQK